MKGRPSVFAIVASLIVLVILVAGYISSRPKGSDREQIVSALDDSIKASKEGRAGGVLDKLSDAFKVNGEKPGARRVADLIHKYEPEIDVDRKDPSLTGDEAQIVSPVTVRVDALGIKADYKIPNVTLRFHREEGRAWLIFPVPKWRLTDIQVPSDALDSLEGLGGGMGGFGGF